MRRLVNEVPPEPTEAARCHTPDGGNEQFSGSSCFEVTANGELIYSKAKTGQFPEIEEIRQALKGKLG